MSPLRFPITVSDLDAWAVFADWLQIHGDSRGELIAHELTLPELPDREALRAFHELAHRTCRQRPASPIAFSLAHARTLTIPPRPGIMMRSSQGPDPGTIASMRDYLQKQPRAALLEECWIAYAVGATQTKHWIRFMWAIPPSCTRMGILMFLPMTEAQLDELLGWLPNHVRELAFAFVPSRRSTGALVDVRPEIALASHCIDDRFDLIDLTRFTIVRPIELDALRAALARTTHVRVRLGWATDTNVLPMGRIEFGQPGDAALVRVTDRMRSTVVMRRWSLSELQQRFHIVPIRTLLARSLPEGYGIVQSTPPPSPSPSGQGLPSMLHISTNPTHDFMRRGDSWTLRVASVSEARPEERFVRRNGVRLENGGIVNVEYGDRFAFYAEADEEDEWTLCPA